MSLKRRLAGIERRLPKPQPEPVISTFDELAAKIETLLSMAEKYPDLEAGRYTLKARAKLALALFERARQRWVGSPIPFPSTPEMRAMLLVEEITPQEATLLYSLVGLRGPKLAWVTGHFVQTSPDGSTEAVEVDDLIWIRDEDPHFEGRTYFSGGHFEDEAGQRPAWINAHYELDWR